MFFIPIISFFISICQLVLFEKELMNCYNYGVIMSVIIITIALIPILLKEPKTIAFPTISRHRHSRSLSFTTSNRTRTIRIVRSGKFASRGIISPIYTTNIRFPRVYKYFSVAPFLQKHQNIGNGAGLFPLFIVGLFLHILFYLLSVVSVLTYYFLRLILTSIGYGLKSH
jgi:hypothetical protein